MTAIAHTNYVTWRWVLWILLPARALHELTHAAVGRRWADRVWIDWRTPSARFKWVDAPKSVVVLTHIAPTLIGYAIGLGLFVGAVSGVLRPETTPVWIWLFANWLYYSWPTRDDLMAIGL